VRSREPTAGSQSLGCDPRSPHFGQWVGDGQIPPFIDYRYVGRFQAIAKQGQRERQLRGRGPDLRLIVSGDVPPMALCAKGQRGLQNQLLQPDRSYVDTLIVHLIWPIPGKVCEFR
jgi:hypothetical protein